MTDDIKGKSKNHNPTGLTGSGSLKDNPPPKAVIDQIYDKMNELFNSDNQLFMMEFPGRVLNEDLYAYKTDSIYSELCKPQTVVEEEFRLTDDLFDVGHISGGPNGSKLSDTFDEALNMLVPAYLDMPDFNNDQEKIRNWLMETIDCQSEGLTKKTSRIQQFQALNEQYQQAKSDWETKKIQRLEEAKKSEQPDALDNYARWLATEAAVQESKLEGLFADLVVRGYYHKVKTNLGYLDIASDAEALEKTKARMRASSMSSLDESETIYPVQIQPNNWYKSLSTDFTPVDLLLDPDFLRQKLSDKENELAELQTQYASLQSAHSGDEKELELEVNQAQQNLDSAQTEMIKNFSDAVITAVQLYFAHAGKKPDPTDKLEDFKKSDDGKNANLTDAEWAKIKDLQGKTIDNQQKLISCSRALAQLQAKQAAAESSDVKQSLLLIKSKIESTKSAIEELKAILSNNLDPSKQKSAFPSMPKPSEWMDVSMSFSTSDMSQTSSLESGASHTNWSVDLLFGSAGGSDSKSWSNFSSDSMTSGTTIDIGFRVTKVTVNRGGWFNPALFKNSKSMFKLNNTRIADAIPAKPFSQYNKPDFKNINDNFFPAFPVAFIIAKDVSITFKANSDHTSSVKDVLNKNSSVGGGFLCFSASHSESSNSSSEKFYHKADSESVMIKIPGPQILGWYLEFIAKDESSSYKKMPDNYLNPDYKANIPEV